MIIQAKFLRMLIILLPIVAIPAVLLDMFEPSGRLGHVLHSCAFPFLLALGGAGAFAAILQRAGVIQIRYTEDDKKRLHYRMARFIAEMEHRRGRSFSRHYYESYGLTHPHDKPAA